MAGTEGLTASLSPRESTSASSPYAYKPTRKSSPVKSSLSGAFQDLRGELDLASATITQLTADKTTLKLALRTANDTKDQLQTQLHDAHLLARRLTKENSQLKARLDRLKQEAKDVDVGRGALQAENDELRRLTDELEREIRDLDVNRESLRQVMTHGRGVATGRSLGLRSYWNFVKATLPELGTFAAMFRSRVGTGEFETLLDRNLCDEALLRLLQFVCDLISSELQTKKRKTEANKLAETRQIATNLKASFTLSRRPT